MSPQRKVFLPLVMVFIIFNALFLTGRSWLAKWNIDQEVVIWANLLFFVISLLVFLMQRKALSDKNPHVFVRSVMGGMMIKMLVCIIAVVAYVMAAGKNYSKPAVFVSLGLYIVYLAVEVGVIMKLNRRTDA